MVFLSSFDSVFLVHWYVIVKVFLCKVFPIARVFWMVSRVLLGGC